MNRETIEQKVAELKAQIEKEIGPNHTEGAWPFRVHEYTYDRAIKALGLAKEDKDFGEECVYVPGEVGSLYNPIVGALRKTFGRGEQFALYEPVPQKAEAVMHNRQGMGYLVRKHVLSQKRAQRLAEEYVREQHNDIQTLLPEHRENYRLLCEVMKIPRLPGKEI